MHPAPGRSCHNWQFHRADSGLALLFYIAIWTIATGVVQLLTALRLRLERANEWILILAGLVSVAFGVLLMARPGPERG